MKVFGSLVITSYGKWSRNMGINKSPNQSVNAEQKSLERQPEEDPGREEMGKGHFEDYEEAQVVMILVVLMEKRQN
ncbi:unnamed protein product [Caretta caretta]